MTEHGDESAGSAKDLLAKFDKIENPNSPGRKPRAPKVKDAPKDIYKPQNLGATPPAGKSVTANPFLQIDRDHKIKVQAEAPTPAQIYLSKASDGAKASGLAIKQWTTKVIQDVKSIGCLNIREKPSSTGK